MGLLFLEEILAGLLYGAAVSWLHKSVDNYQVEIFLTLAVVTGGSSSAPPTRGR